MSGFQPLVAKTAALIFGWAKSNHLALVAEVRQRPLGQFFGDGFILAAQSRVLLGRSGMYYDIHELCQRKPCSVSSTMSIPDRHTSHPTNSFRTVFIGRYKCRGSSASEVNPYFK